MGYQAAGFTNSPEALNNRIENGHQVDLVVTDMTMPKLTGTALAAEITRHHPNLPIVLCSGYSEKLDLEETMPAGVHAFVMQPVIFKDLARQTRSVLDARTGRLAP